MMKKFGFILNKIYKILQKIMGFKANNINGAPKNGASNISEDRNVKLSKEELELLLITIKNSLFKGENVEILYNLTLKLQKSYLDYNKN